jgi:hypothetical protein
VRKPPVTVQKISRSAFERACRKRAMPTVYRSRLERYLASMIQVKRMLSKGIISPTDYVVIDTILANKYGISSCSVYRGIDLIYQDLRGNMSHYKEVRSWPNR